MRIAVFVILALCTVSRAASADVITSFEGDDSLLYYGGPTAQYSAVGLWWPTTDSPPPLYAVASITMDTLVATSFTAGTSTYQYAGGDLFMTFFDPQFGGLFEAKVLDLTVTVLEVDTLPGSTYVTAVFRLGAGLLDAPLAAALGIDRHTVGGSVVDPWLHGFDYPSDAERFADEGAPTATIVTPEPSLLALLALGVGMSTPIIARRARSRRRT